jgi:hypothetical protein
MDADNALTIRVFSDSIVITSPCSAEGLRDLLLMVQRLQRAFIHEGILLRGGVALGKHYEDERTVFSDALVEAYRLESGVARVPRVVVGKNVLELFDGRAADADQALTAAVTACHLRDRDGQRFVDYLGSEHIADHRAIIESMGTKLATSDVGLLQKHLWLIEYHNYTVRRRCDPREVDGLLIDDPGPFNTEGSD